VTLGARLPAHPYHTTGHAGPRPRARLKNADELSLMARAPVGGVRPALEHAINLHAVQEAHHGHRIYIGQLGPPAWLMPWFIFRRTNTLQWQRVSANSPARCSKIQRVAAAGLQQQEAEAMQSIFRPLLLAPRASRPEDFGARPPVIFP
jgi:hypothetical protein